MSTIRRLTRIDLAVIAGQDAMCQLGDLADDLDACRARPHHDKREISFAFRRVGCQLCHFERTQYVIPEVPSILQRLHSGREFRPLVVPEIRMGCASRYHQCVVRQRYSCSVRRDYRNGSSLQVEVHDLAEYHIGVLLFLHNATQRRCDQALRQDAGRNLIQQRLEQVMVRPVDYRQVDIGLRQDSADVDAAETAANHNDFGARTCRRALVQFGLHLGGGAGLLQSIFDCTEVSL